MIVKKLIAFILTLLFVFSFSGCVDSGSSANETTRDSAVTTAPETDPSIDNLKEIDSIVFDSKGHAFADALEAFYQDTYYTYYFPNIISKYVTVTYTDGSTENVKDALANRHILITDLDRYDIRYEKISNNIEKIVDTTISADDALECFYWDENYLYYFHCIKSQYVTVYYKDGTEQNIKDALSEGKILISALDLFDIDYRKQSKDPRPMLTISELKSLVATYGENLTRSHFEGFYGYDADLGSNIACYYIIHNNRYYTLEICGAKDEIPVYICLVSTNHDAIDVRTESIDDFLKYSNSPPAPEDFSFALTWGPFGISSYDSKTGKLVKTTNATNPADYITIYEIESWKMAYIYELISALDVNSYPDIYDPGNGLSEPSATLILTVRIGDTEKTIKAEDISLFFVSDNDKGQAFLDTCEAMSDILTSTHEWKLLPDYENLYE